MAEPMTTMFGKAYDTVGSADKNLILLTRGDLKVKWGNKFIDLIKNGKINVDAEFIKKVDNKDSINKDGIYVIENENGTEVWLYLDGTLINLQGEIGTTYVSFIGTQEVESDAKIRALTNAGFYYETLDEAKKANISKGLIYIISSGKLYVANNGEITEYKQEFSVPDPLKVGNITIDGNGSIKSTSELNLYYKDSAYISLSDFIDANRTIITKDGLRSDDYTLDTSGYSIYYDKVNNLACAEFDYVKVRYKLEVIDITPITYAKLRESIREGILRPERKYRIIDFLNEWEVTKEPLYEDKVTSTNPMLGKGKNVWPIVVKAKTPNTLYPEFYFADNEKWVGEYDVDFYHLVRKEDAQGNALDPDTNLTENVTNIFSKGRITKLVDEKGNQGNYDFKHKLFKHTQESDDINNWYYTFNIANPDYNQITYNPFVYSNVHINADASQLDEKIVNNIINIGPPKLEDITIKDDNNNTVSVKRIVFEDEQYIIFEDCSIYKPHDNKILDSTGKYAITNDFYNNKFEGIYWDDEEEIVEFDLDFHDNTFLKVDNCILDAPMHFNTFDNDMEYVNIQCSQMENNHITGTINTNGGAEIFPIEVGVFSDNIINNIITSKITCSNCNITNNIFHDIIGYHINNTNITDTEWVDLIGNSSDVPEVPDRPGDNPGSDTPSNVPNWPVQTVSSGINDYVPGSGSYIESWGMRWYTTPGPTTYGFMNYTTYLTSDPSTIYNAQLPEAISVNGTTYYRQQYASPGSGYTETSIQQFGISYYAWVKDSSSSNNNPENSDCSGCSVGMSRFVSGAQGYGGPAPGTGLTGTQTIGQYTPVSGCNDFPTFTLKEPNEGIASDVMNKIRTAWANVTFSFDNLSSTDEEGHSRGSGAYFVKVSKIPANPVNLAIHFYFIPSCNSSDKISFNQAAGTGEEVVEEIPEDDPMLDDFINKITGGHLNSEVTTTLTSVISNTATPKTYSYLKLGYNFVSGKSDNLKSWMLANMLAELTPHVLTTSNIYKERYVNSAGNDTATSYFVNAAKCYGGLKIAIMSNEQKYMDRINGAIEYAKFKHAYYSSSNTAAEEARTELRGKGVTLAAMVTDSDSNSSTSNDNYPNPYFTNDLAVHVLPILPDSAPSNASSSADWTYAQNMITQYPTAASMSSLNYQPIMDKEAADSYFCKILGFNDSNGRYARYLYKCNDIGDAAGNHAKKTHVRARPGTLNNLNAKNGSTTFTVPTGGSVYLCDCELEFRDQSAEDYNWSHSYDCSATNGGETYCEKDVRLFTDDTANSTLGSHENPYKSYSSGHSSRAMMNLLLLIEAAGDSMSKDGYTSRATRIHQYCDNRAIMRAHWKSDTIAGRLASSMQIGYLNGFKELHQEIARL